VSSGAPEGWQRLHPLSPVVRGGRATIGIFTLLLLIALGGDTFSTATPEFLVIAIVVLAGVVSWLVTRWRIEEDDLRIETGLLRRQSLRFPLAQVQAIDVVRPGLARLFRVAELRLRMAGSSGGTARLAYVAEHEVEPLRDQLLALARGARHDEAPAAELDRPLPEEHVLATVETAPLVASILLENWWIVVVLAALLAGFAVSPHTVSGALGGGGFVWAVAMVTFVWRRFNQQYRLTVAEGPDGLHLRGGLVALTAELIRPGRVQAVRLVEPALWRPLGWCRLEVDIAGKQRRKGEG
jgi:putative membrane protein